MKLVKPSFEILEQKPKEIVVPADMEIGPRMVKEELLNSIYRQIEIAGRTCYKSEDKITDTSAKEFVERMIKSGHGAMLEHGTVYLKTRNYGDSMEDYDCVNMENKYIRNPYSKVIFGDYPTHCKTWEEKQKAYQDVYITTNYRVLVENNWLGDLQYICEPTEFHENRYTVKFVCDRGVSHEFVRHRVFSFAQESTRYCNYSKDKFGNELTFIQPCWSLAPMSPEDYNGSRFLEFLHESEDLYLSLIKEGWKPQEARAILPNALKTELVMTGFTSDWKHFFELRDASSAHPQARELAQPLHEEFIKRRYL